MLMTTLKGAIEDQNQLLWGLLKIDKDITLDRMMSLTAEWTIKTPPQSASVANYVSLPGDLKKAQARKQNSGRGSGKGKFTRAVVSEKEKCFACNRPGHIVADCKDKKAKDA